MKGKAIFTILLSRVDMKTPVATIRNVGHLFAGEDTEGVGCLRKKNGIHMPDAVPLTISLLYLKLIDPAKEISLS